MKPPVQRWTVGSAELMHVIDRANTYEPQALFESWTPDVRGAFAPWLDAFCDGERLAMATGTLVVRTAESTVLIDTGFGSRPIPAAPALSHLETGFLDRLEEAGVHVDDVDMVICTHLHFDHTGWNTRWNGSAWVPTFPRARYIMSRVDYEAGPEGDVGASTFDDAVRPVVEAGRADLVEAPAQVTPEIRLVPAEGHTAGHWLVEIESQGDRAVITGDLMHHPVQFVRPSWSIGADLDPVLAESTRRAFYARCAGSGILVVGSHFAGFKAGFIEADGDSYKFVSRASELL